MTRSHKVLGFILVALLGIYGCTRGPAGSAGGSTAALEAKVQRLEEDFRAAAAARDSFRQKFQAAEERQGALQRQLDQTTAAAQQDRQDRDAARTELKARTAERDNVVGQYESFRKNIRELLGQADAAMNSAAAPAATLANTTAPGLPTIPVAPTTTAAPASPSPEPTAALRN